MINFTCSKRPKRASGIIALPHISSSYMLYTSCRHSPLSVPTEIHIRLSSNLEVGGCLSELGVPSQVVPAFSRSSTWENRNLQVLQLLRLKYFSSPFPLIDYLVLISHSITFLMFSLPPLLLYFQHPPPPYGKNNKTQI